MEAIGITGLREMTAGVNLSELEDRWGHCQREVSAHKCSLVRETSLWEMMLWGLKL